MKTKVNNCGKYECVNCGSQGQCLLSSISIGQDGKCIMFRESEYKKATPRYNPIDEHTNMC